MSPEKIALHEPTAVKRDKNQGTSGEPVYSNFFWIVLRITFVIAVVYKIIFLLMYLRGSLAHFWIYLRLGSSVRFE